MYMPLSLCIWFVLSSSQEDGGRDGRAATPPPLSRDPLISTFRGFTAVCTAKHATARCTVCVAHVASKSRAVCLGALIPVSLKKKEIKTLTILAKEMSPQLDVCRNMPCFESPLSKLGVLNKTSEGGNYVSCHAFLNAFGCEWLFLHAVEETVAFFLLERHVQPACLGHRVTGSIASRDIITLTAKTIQKQHY